MRPSIGLTAAPGRGCPLDYRYPPSVFRRAPDIVAETLYVIGGLYGNIEALDAILSMAAQESARPVLVFNGDFHWFDIDGTRFEAIDAVVHGHVALRGNVETEIARDDASAGCGCAYPETVSDDDVARSNAILDALRRTAKARPDARARLALLPMHAVARVGDARVGIVHGDAESLAGWRFDPAAMDRPEGAAWAARAFADAGVDVFASSHTCMPGLRAVAREPGPGWVVNNGAAGMANFAGTTHGLITRISLHAPSGPAPLYGARSGSTRIDALPVVFDIGRWGAAFLRSWPAGSPAHASYWRRITEGPDWTIGRAAP
jgi:hypothetical protein